MTKPMPKIDLPPAICSTAPGTWAYDTMSRRVDAEILQRTFEDNKETFESSGFESILKRFNDLRQELQNAATTKVTYLDDLPTDPTVSDERKREWEEWRQLLQPYVEAGDTWLTAPWMVSKIYFGNSV